MNESLFFLSLQLLVHLTRSDKLSGKTAPFLSLRLFSVCRAEDGDDLPPKKNTEKSALVTSLLPLFLLLQREMDEARLRGLRVETHVQPGRTGKGKGRKEGEREKWNSRERRLREEAKEARGDAPRASLFFFFLRFFSFSSPSTSLT